MQLLGAKLNLGERTMTKEEINLLLFFETCAVDSCGKINTAHMNENDFEIAKKWDQTEFVRFGRIASADINNDKTHWCLLSQDAWKKAAEARMNRAMANWAKRVWHTTFEIKNST